MLSRLLRIAGIAHVVLGALFAVLLLTPPNAEHYGDRLQVALPLIAWGCAATQNNGKELFVRFAAMFTVMHGSKQLLGDLPINQRPNGGSQGFPSGHTAAATFGASALANECIAKNPIARTIVIFAGAYVGASRMAVNKHDIIQVFAGAILGVFAERALRHESPARQRVLHGAALISRRFALGARTASRLMQQLLLSLSRRRTSLPGILAGFLLLVSFPQSAFSEVELSVYGGLQTAPHSTIRNSDIGNAFVKWEGRSFEMPPYYGLRATWWRNEKLGFGISFNHAKIYADDPASYGYDQLEMTDGLNLLTAGVWRRFPGNSPWTPYLGAGLGVAVPHVEVQPTGQAATIGYRVTGPALQITGGVSYRISDRWALFGEYSGSYSRHRFSLNSGGTFSTEIITNAINLGASLRF